MRTTQQIQCLSGFLHEILHRLKIIRRTKTKQKRNKNRVQKSENPLFMGKTRKDEQRQTNLNSNPNNEKFR